MFTSTEKDRWESHASALALGVLAAILHEGLIPCINSVYNTVSGWGSAAEYEEILPGRVVSLTESCSLTSFKRLVA